MIFPICQRSIGSESQAPPPFSYRRCILPLSFLDKDCEYSSSTIGKAARDSDQNTCDGYVFRRDTILDGSYTTQVSDWIKLEVGVAMHLLDSFHSLQCHLDRKDQ